MISGSDWLADSAETTHIARNKLCFTDYITKPNEIEGITPGSPLKTIGRGTIKLDFLVKNKKIFTVQLKDVKHAPMAPNNLISIGRLMDHRFITIWLNLHGMVSNPRHHKARFLWKDKRLGSYTKCMPRLQT